MNYQDMISEELVAAQNILHDFMEEPENIKKIEDAATFMAASLKNNGKIISCGNGGSMCDSMHFAEELTGRYRENRKPYAAVAISDPSYISCVSNDFGYHEVFSRFIDAFGQKGDVLLAISSSGNSKNVLEAAKVATKKQIMIVSLTGKNGGELSRISDININVPYNAYADRIQEVHIKIIHILIYLIEKMML